MNTNTTYKLSDCLSKAESTNLITSIWCALNARLEFAANRDSVRISSEGYCDVLESYIRNTLQSYCNHVYSFMKFKMTCAKIARHWKSDAVITVPVDSIEEADCVIFKMNNLLDHYGLDLEKDKELIQNILDCIAPCLAKGVFVVYNHTGSIDTIVPKVSEDDKSVTLVAMLNDAPLPL